MLPQGPLRNQNEGLGVCCDCHAVSVIPSGGMGQKSTLNFSLWDLKQQEIGIYRKADRQGKSLFESDLLDLLFAFQELLAQVCVFRGDLGRPFEVRIGKLDFPQGIKSVSPSVITLWN